MEKFYITKVGNIFRSIGFKEGEKEPENKWLVLDIDSFDNRSGGEAIYVEIINYWSHLNSKEKFHLDSSCSGSCSSDGDYSYKFKLGWNIKEQNGKSHTLIISGKVLIRGFYSNIVSYICRFLNELYQYDSIEEYLASKEVYDDSEWKSKDMCDKIVALAKVIELYQKYKSINPALLIVQEMEKTIENRLREIIKK